MTNNKDWLDDFLNSIIWCYIELHAKSKYKMGDPRMYSKVQELYEGKKKELTTHYVTKEECEKRVLEANVKARNDFWNKLELSYIADVISQDLVDEDFKKLIDDKLEKLSSEIDKLEQQLKELSDDKAE